MRLYHFPLSSNSRRAHMTAVHLGAPVELVVVDLARGEQRKPDYLGINPNGKVPVLDDDGFVLWESHAIMQYLADKTPGQTIYPTELRARADVNRWLFWSANHFQPAVSVLNFEHSVKAIMGLGPADPEAVKRGEAMLGQLLGVLDAHLSSHPWMTQGKVTLADFALATPLMSAERARLPMKERANVLRWFAQVQELDAWKKTTP